MFLVSKSYNGNKFELFLFSNFEREMKVMDIKEFSSEYFKIIDFVHSFFSSLENWNVEEYITQCGKIIQYLKNASDDEIKNLELAYVCNKDLLYMKTDLVKDSDVNQVCRLTELVYHSYAFSKKIYWNDELYAEQGNKIIEEIEDYYFENQKQQQQNYYKNLFDEKYYEEFENILCLIRDNLRLYDMNMIYCKKIVDFLTNEFSKKGIFISQTMFIKNYLNNATDSMILIICKLILDIPNIGKKEKCGMSYLKSYISNNLNEESRKIVQDELKYSKKKINEIKKMTEKLEDLRNSQIAHYDIKKIENVNKIKMSIEEFEAVFDLLCEILELLSMKYFLYESTFSYDMITIHGFKSFVCQNPFLHKEKTELDAFLDMLRKDFVIS